MLSLVTESPVITAFHSFFWPSRPLGFETAIFWQCSPGTVETQRLSPLRHGHRRWIFWSYKSLLGLPESGPYRIFVLVFNWNDLEMRLLNLRIIFFIYCGLCQKKKINSHVHFIFEFLSWCCCFFHTVIYQVFLSNIYDLHTVFGFKYSYLILITILSSSCRAAITDIPDPLSPPLSIVHRLWQVFRAICRILT